VHPLVLLSVVDHYTRVAKDTNKRVVGVLLGEQVRGQIDITNSYALPFEEDVKDPSIWYIDRQYLEDMFAMFKKVQARERVIGWYSTGPKIRASDLEITELFREYCPQPTLVVIDVNSKENTIEIPTEAYQSIDIEPESQLVAASAAASSATTSTATAAATEQKTSEASTTTAATTQTSIPDIDKSHQPPTIRKQFIHIPSKIEALEAEEVGVEHLLRGIRDVSASTLSDHIRAKLDSLRGLKNRLNDMVRCMYTIMELNICLSSYELSDV
jgi:26S proteasome regulatory subunit N8